MIRYVGLAVDIAGWQAVFVESGGFVNMDDQTYTMKDDSPVVCLDLRMKRTLLLFESGNLSHVESMSYFISSPAAEVRVKEQAKCRHRESCQDSFTCTSNACITCLTQTC